MKVLSLIGSAAISAVLFSSCVCGLKNKAVPAVLDTNVDSLVVNDNVGSFKLAVEVPENNSLAVSKAIGEYVNESLGGSYKGNCTDIRGVAKYYFDAIVSEYRHDFEEFEKDTLMKYSDISSFNVYSEGPDYITYLYEKDAYKGGAHGSYMRYGVTFRKSDGRRIGWDVFNNKFDDDFHNLIKDGLKKYWGLKGDEQLKDYLMNENDIFNLPLPQCNPLFTDDGVEFVYNQYEIAPYSAGSPTFTVPYSKISDYMMYVAKKLVGIE